MSSYRARPSRPDRAKAIVAVVAVHVALAALILSGQSSLPEVAGRVRTVLIDIEPPPPPPPVPDPGRARDEEGVAGKKAEPTPVVAPQPKIVVPAKPPIPAAPIAGTGSSSSAGAASAGSGPGAGGSGTGRGGGGSGGGGIGVQARLLSGGLTRRDYRQLRGFGPPSGQAVLAIMVGPGGRVESCAIADTSGDAGLDATLCAILQQRMRWAAARDTRGQPIPVRAYYVATWDR